MNGVPVRFFGVIVTANYANSFQFPPIEINAADGGFEVGHIAPGDWDVVVMGPGFAKAIIPGVHVETGKMTRIDDIKVNIGFTISGQVTDTNGNAAPRAEVQMVRSAALSASLLDNLAHGNYHTITDSHGEYLITGVSGDLQGGNAMIFASMPSDGKSLARTVPNGNAKIDLTLRPTGAIVGVVSNTINKRWVVVAAQSLSQPDGHLRVSHQDSDGFAFDDVPEGDYAIVVIVPDAPNSVLSARVTVNASDTASVSISLTCSNLGTVCP